MKCYWETIIEPVLEFLRPRSVVEVGSDTGANTRNTLEFCRRSDARLHLVDPLPKYDVSDRQDLPQRAPCHITRPFAPIQVSGRMGSATHVRTKGG